MKIYVTGHEGGRVRDALVNRGVSPILSDITDKKGILDEIHTANPDVVIHAAAMTGVEKCQTDYKSAFVINVRGTANVAEACKNVGATIIYLSTCHIFDGKKRSTEFYSEMSRPNPMNYYGFTKWEGEEVIPIFGGRYMIIRISKIFDREPFKSYLESVHIPSIEKPTFIYRNYTYLGDFVDLLLEISENYIDFSPHMKMNLGTLLPISMFQFWGMVLGDHIKPRNEPDPTILPRPFNGMLDMSVALDYKLKLPTVAESLLRMIQEM